MSVGVEDCANGKARRTVRETYHGRSWTVARTTGTEPTELRSGEASKMAMLGELVLEHKGGIHAGLALKLARPSSIGIEMTYKDATIRLAKNHRTIVCAFDNVGGREDTIEHGSAIIQEALDILSMSGKEHLVTQDVHSDYTAWWENGNEKILCIASICVSNTPTLQISFAVSGGKPATITPPSYTKAFRYFRLAQYTDDLFDSYRNMYLAFENMLSDRFPRSKKKKGKRRESEKEWIQRALEDAPELNLLTSPLRHDLTIMKDIVDTIYDAGRLPLFHAKSYEVFYSPHECREQRTAVTNALFALTHVVVRMADTWYNTRYMRQGWNLNTIKEVNRKIFEGCDIVCSPTKISESEAAVAKTDNQSVVNGIKASTTIIDSTENPFGIEIVGRFCENKIKKIDSFCMIYATKDGNVCLFDALENDVNLQGFTTLECIIFVEPRNPREPKVLFSR